MKTALPRKAFIMFVFGFTAWATLGVGSVAGVTEDEAKNRLHEIFKMLSWSTEGAVFSKQAEGWQLIGHSPAPCIYGVAMVRDDGLVSAVIGTAVLFPARPPSEEFFISFAEFKKRVENLRNE